ncbi:MAG: hypothetical protein ACXWZF_00740 [Actinomycetota bacterium]
MNKRSALMVAAGLILTLVVGGLAVAIGLTGPSVSSAVPRAGRTTPEPVVRTVKRTVTVHKEAEPQHAGVVQVPASVVPAASSSTSVSDDSSGGYEEHENEDGSEDHSEGEHGGGEGGAEDD